MCHSLGLDFWDSDVNFIQASEPAETLSSWTYIVAIRLFTTTFRVTSVSGGEWIDVPLSTWHFGLVYTSQRRSRAKTELYGVIYRLIWHFASRFTPGDQQQNSLGLVQPGLSRLPLVQVRQPSPCLGQIGRV
jgi:hypothetical protein